MGSNHMHDHFRRNKEEEKQKFPIPEYDPQTGEKNPLYEELTGKKVTLEANGPFPEPTLDELCDFLSNKYKYQSSGEAHAIMELIEFYKDNKEV